MPSNFVAKTKFIISVSLGQESRGSLSGSSGSESLTRRQLFQGSAEKKNLLSSSLM